jgi:hypothetical protein
MSIRVSPSPQCPLFAFNLQSRILAIAHPDVGHTYCGTQAQENSTLPPVEIGDVDFIRQGKFHRLFNALYSENHPRNHLTSHVSRG